MFAAEKSSNCSRKPLMLSPHVGYHVYWRCVAAASLRDERAWYDEKMVGLALVVVVFAAGDAAENNHLQG
jgi:hypothetical protein